LLSGISSKAICNGSSIDWQACGGFGLQDYGVETLPVLR
jgi:hypothetical protein